MGLVTIKAQIIVKLQAITAIKQVFNTPISPFKEKFQVAQYPIAVVIPSGNENDYLTNHENMRAFPFEIYLVTKVANDILSNGWSVLEALVDTVIDAFDTDTTALNNSVLYALPSPSVVEIIGRDSKETVIQAVVTLKCFQSLIVS